MSEQPVVSSKIDLNARLKAMGIEYYTEHSPEVAARAVEELAHIDLGMDMGTWSRISSTLLGCIARCARLENITHETRVTRAECDGGQCGLGGFCKDCPHLAADVLDLLFESAQRGMTRESLGIHRVADGTESQIRRPIFDGDIVRRPGIRGGFYHNEDIPRLAVTRDSRLYSDGYYDPVLVERGRIGKLWDAQRAPTTASPQPLPATPPEWGEIPKFSEKTGDDRA